VPTQRITGVVELHVELTEVRMRLRHGLLDLLGVGHIERQWEHGVAETFLQIGDACHVAGSRGYLVAAGEDGFRPNAAEATGCAGDKPSLFHVSLPVLRDRLLRYVRQT
jgi:hypothetical protein